MTIIRAINDTINSHLAVVILIWLCQLVIMAMFDTRNGTSDKLLNWSALATSLVVTYLWGGIFWLLIPILIIPILGGYLGGMAMRNKSRSRQPEKNNR